MGLNVHLLKQVRAAIAKADEKKGTGFNMGSWFRRELDGLFSTTYTDCVSDACEHYGECGTTACIAGHTVGLAGRRRGEDDVESEAQELLGLNIRDADYLFRGRWSRHSIMQITKGETLKYLDKCIKAERIVR